MGCALSSSKSKRSQLEKCFENQLWISESKTSNAMTLPPKGLISNQPVATRITENPSICDEFQECCNEDHSYGYFSESLSTANLSDLSFNADDCDLKMEMYMMTKISRVMPKTSSPILPPKFPSRHSQQRNEATYEAEYEQPEPYSYIRWKHYLQRTPPYVLTNITRIPEAIAGQFTPEGFPGYTDMRRFQRGNSQRRPARIPPYVIRH